MHLVWSCGLQDFLIFVINIVDLKSRMHRDHMKSSYQTEQKKDVNVCMQLCV